MVGIGVLKGYTSVHNRPAEIKSKETVGHWEGDFVIGSHSTVVSTLVERKTKYLKLVAMSGRSADDLTKAIHNVFRYEARELCGL